MLTKPPKYVPEMLVFFSEALKMESGSAEHFRGVEKAIALAVSLLCGRTYIHVVHG